MDLYGIFAAIEASGVGTWVRETLNVLPVINALHVVAVAIVFGTIFIVDLRLLGFPNTQRSFKAVGTEVLKWTWAGFALALATGFLMFAANATTFYGNTQFWLKMGALLLAGINMAVFEFITITNVDEWDKDKPTPKAAKIAGLLSIFLWATVIVLGRWIGYTKGFNFGAVEMDLNSLDFLL
jgi:hypothetical protein